MLLTGLISVFCISFVCCYDSPGDLVSKIDVLAVDVTSLEKSIDQLQKLEHEEGLKLRVLHKHMYNAEGSSCPEPWFQLQCSDSRSCVPQYLVCDGIKHCPNGDDEKGCDIEDYVTVGEIFEGTLVMSDCADDAITHFVGRVDSIDKDDIFPNLPKYTLTYYNTGPDETRSNPRDQEKWLPAATSGHNDWAGLDQIREFDLVDHDIIIQRGYRMGSRKLCMQFFMKRRTTDEPFPSYEFFA